jgi:hypothetical protein
VTATSPASAALDRERVLLGVLLLKPHLVARAAATVDPRDFQDRKHRLLFEALVELAALGQAFDADLISELVHRRHGTWPFEPHGVTPLLQGLPLEALRSDLRGEIEGALESQP